MTMQPYFWTQNISHLIDRSVIFVWYLMKMTNEPSTLEMSDDSGSDSDSNHDGENEDGSPMMSIFASYYGIEEPVDDTAPKGTIDDSNFQPESYVKVR
jgi:hypothetical protein